jgi:hypothetical protein
MSASANVTTTNTDHLSTDASTNQHTHAQIAQKQVQMQLFQTLMNEMAKMEAQIAALNIYSS